MDKSNHIREMILRLSRLEAATGWEGDLNPAQRAVLSYLARANRFSRSPSHVASYLGATRGTISQSLKSLMQKGYLAERRSSQDRRVISCDLTEKGWQVVAAQSPLEEALRTLPEDDRDALQRILKTAARQVLKTGGAQEFGLCRTCIHHLAGAEGPRCNLLSVDLTREEADQICFEQVSA